MSVDLENPVSLSEIKSWGKGKVTIPVFQRGLVWSPKQIEFLWDSILRNFPIGGFVLSESTNKTFYLLDGQQRLNAIQQGFLEPDEKSDAVLWLDTAATEGQDNSSRKFFVKVTTKIHPWGFKNDNDNVSVLNAGEKREALEKFGMEGKNIFKDEINLMQTFPFVAEHPVPLSYLLNAPLDSEEAFSEDVMKKLEKLSQNWKSKKRQNVLTTKEEVKKYFQLVKTILKDQPYSVPFSVLSADTIAQETESSAEQTALEILFNRLNTGGTQISRADLQYSAIKAYWGDGFRDKIDSLADGRMPPQTLAMLFLRLALTIENSSTQKFQGNLSIKQIRDLARNDKTRQYVEEFVQKNGNILKQIDNALLDLPQYLVMKIVSLKQDIYLLLMFLAYKEYDLKQIKASSLAMLLHWFCIDTQGCVNKLYESFCIGENIAAEQKVISSLIIGNKIRKIYSPDELKSFLKDPCDFESFKDIILQPKYDMGSEQRLKWECWEIISNFRRTDTGDTLLVFAEKEFLNEYFPKYNPANVRDWDKTNRPWDYDHIIPKGWSEYRSRSEPYKEIVDYWLWRTGNFAAIPFEENRSKNAYSEYSFYEKHTDKLLFAKEFESVEKDFVKDESQAKTFAKAVFERTIAIYESCYNFISAWL